MSQLTEFLEQLKTFLLTFFVITTILYLGASFLAADMNPNHWRITRGELISWDWKTGLNPVYSNDYFFVRLILLVVIIISIMAASDTHDKKPD